MAEPLSNGKHQAGRAALDTFLSPVIEATPWLYRSKVQEYLSNAFRDQIVEVVGTATRDASD